MLRETLKQFAQYKAKSSGLIPHLVPTLACEHPYSHSWPNCPFSAQPCDGFGRDESKGKSGSHGRAEEETPEVSVELRQKACADLAQLSSPPDSTAVSFPGIYYLGRADKNKQGKKDHSVMQSNLNCSFVFVL